MESITHDNLIQEFADGVSKCDTLHGLVEYGAGLFSISYIDSIVKRSWGVFAARLNAIAPDDRDKHVAVVDLPAIFHAAFEKDEEGAISGTISRIESAIQAIGKVDSTVIAMDSPKNLRREKHPRYKATRPAKPPQFNPIRDETIEKLIGLGYPVVVREGWESDDVMASAAFRAKLRRHTCTIITEDRDLLQCCGNGVTCYSPRTQENRGEAWLKANHSLVPKQVVDWLCLLGKDNAPAATGVGAKTATGLLSKLGSFWSIFDSLGLLVEQKELTRKRAGSIREFALSGDYFIARELHELNKSLEVSW